MPGPAPFGVFALHQVRDADRKLDDLEAALDVAARIFDRLAVFLGQQIGEFVILAMDEIDELHQDARAPLRVHRRPFGLRRLGVRHRGVHFIDIGQRDLGLHLAGHRHEHVAFASALARNRLTVDEMTDLSHAAPPPDTVALHA